MTEIWVPECLFVSSASALLWHIIGNALNQCLFLFFYLALAWLSANKKQAKHYIWNIEYMEAWIELKAQYAGYVRYC